ncbi:cupin domain-containing protein [Bacillus sp. AK031]
MKKRSKKRRGLKIVLAVVAVIVLSVTVFLISVRPGEETDDMLFDVGFFNPISFIAFEGNGYVSNVVGNDDTFNVPSMLNISFEPSARTRWHTHDSGQILLGTYGSGYYQVEGGTPQIVREGDVVLIDPDVKHWHGAGADGWFSHIAITNPGGGESHFLEDITDEYYSALEGEVVEYTERGPLGFPQEALAGLGDGALFPLGEPYDYSGHAAGGIYMETLIPNEDVFNFPETSSITFEPGSRTDWHSTDGGQILIALGGEGVSQIEGESVVTMKAGDVVMLEPGIKYWYGADSESWFSHILIDANPERAAVNWYEPVEEQL